MRLQDPGHTSRRRRSTAALLPRGVSKGSAAVAILAILFLNGPPPVAASGPGEMQKLRLEVLIDGISTNLIAEIQKAPDGRLSARRSELREVGVAVPTGKDTDIVAFDTIPGFGMRYDEPEQRLYLTLAPETRLAREYVAGAENGLVTKPSV
jgi:outer membrane usher protein